MVARIAVAGFIFLAGIGSASADTTSEGLVRDFVAWVDSSSDWSASVSEVRTEADNTLAEGVVFSREEPHVSISIETLRLRDLKPREGGGFSASEIEMSGGAVTSDAIQAAIPSGEVWNISMPSLAGVTLDTKHLMTAIARFYSVAAEGSLDELKIPVVTFDQRRAPMGGDQPIATHAEYHDLSMTGLADGVLQHEELGPMKMSSSGPGDQKFDATFDKIEADRLDLGAIARIFDASAYRDGRGDNIWRPLLSRAVYSGMSGSGGHGGTFTAHEFAIENVDGRQPEKPFTDLWDRLMDPDVAEDSKNDLAMDAVTSMLSAWRVGTIRTDGISADVPKDNVSFSLSSATLSGWSSAGFDSFLLDKLQGSSPDGFLSLGSLELAGFVAPDLKALVKFAALEKDIDIQQHAAAIKQTFAALPRLGHFGLHDVAAGKSQADAGSLKSLTLDFKDWNTIWAGATELHLDELSIPRRLLELDPQTTEIFDTLGYDNLVSSMSLSDHWDPEAGTDNATWTFGMKDAADVEVSYALTGLTVDWLVRATAAAGSSDDSKAAMMAMVNELHVASAKVSVTDRSLLDRGFGVAAQKQGLNVAGSAYREQMRAALPFLISAAVPADIAKLVTAPVQAFLAGGQTITAEAAPPSPLSVADLIGAASNPMGLPNLLNLQLKSAAPAQ